MKRNILYFTIIIFIILIFINYTLVLDTTIQGVDIWLNKVFPYLFIMITLNDLLITLDFKRIFKSTTSYVFIMSLISGSPSSAYIINKLYENNKISLNNAHLYLEFTYFSNPLFLYAFLNILFSNIYITLKIMLIHYISNFIIYLLNRKKIDNENSFTSSLKPNIASSIKSSINTNLFVLGSIIFFMIISNIIITTFNISDVLSVFVKGFLEVTQGLNYLVDLNTTLKLKEILTVFLISFGGLSIHMQIKCILDESNLKYKHFFIGRIKQIVISILLLLISFLFKI